MRWRDGERPMRPFDYYRARSTQEACQLLVELEGEGRVLAGGQSLLNMMKLRIVSPTALIDASRIPELQAIASSPGGISIGAMTTYAALERFALKQPGYEILADALRVIADLHVRHMGTLGGSCCHADPYADMPNVLAALGADLEAVALRGKRRIAAEHFFAGPFETALEPDELLTSIHIPAAPKGTGAAYEKFSWRLGDYAIASVACVMTLEERGRCRSARVVGGSLGTGPARLAAGEETLAGEALSEQVIAKAAASASRSCDPQADAIYGSAEYKQCLIETLAARAMTRAWNRARATFHGWESA